MRRIPFRNDAASQVPPFGILRITGAVDVNSEPYLKVDRPNTYGARLTAVNGPTAIDSGKYGDAFNPSESFFIRALYDSGDGTPTVGQRWGPRNASWKLRKNAPGFEIIGDADTSTTTVLVRYTPVVTLLGKTDASHAKGASGTVSVYAGTLGSETDSTDNVTAWNRFAAISSGKWVRMLWLASSDDIEIIAAEC